MKQKHKLPEILEIGHELLRKQGYHNTGVDDILQACAMPKGSFYHLFKNKENFGVQAVNYYGQRQYRLIQPILSDPAIEPLQRLLTFYDLLRDGLEKEAFRNGCLMGNIALEMGGLSPALATAVEHNLKLIVTLIASCIREGQESGSIRQDQPAAELADMVHNSYYGVLMRSKVSKSSSTYPAFRRMISSYLAKT